MNKSNPLNLLDEVLQRQPKNSQYPTATLILTIIDEGDGVRTTMSIKGAMQERIFHIGVGIANQLSIRMDDMMNHALINIDNNLDECPLDSTSINEIFKPQIKQQEGANDDPET
ncbi:hypothetical protein VoSk93_05640 [Vibrio owensii]